jgi:hypothetical protein
MSTERNLEKIRQIKKQISAVQSSLAEIGKDGFDTDQVFDLLAQAKELLQDEIEQIEADLDADDKDEPDSEWEEIDEDKES